MAALDWTPSRMVVSGDGQYGTLLREPRMGVMVHYDGSTNDDAGLAWFSDPACAVSYQVEVTDEGRWAQIAPDSARAWHAGACRSSDPRLPYKDANSAFYGISALTDDKYQVTTAQLLTMAWKIRMYFRVHRWDPSETWRIVGHDTEAWPRGRKADPTGPNPKNPILAIEDVRWLVPRIRG